MSDQTTAKKETGPSTRACCAWKLMAALVLLRLCVGWHFFSEGIQKVSYDRHSGQWSLDFSAEGFFRGAKGPLAGFFWNRVPGEHDWRNTLATPRELTPSSGEELANWVTGYVKRRQSELKNGTPTEVIIPEFVPFSAWFENIDIDRRKLQRRFTDVSGLTDEQREQAAEVYERRNRQLADYLAGESVDMQAYQHDLWRLENMAAAPGASEVPFQEERLATKTVETSRAPLKWVASVKQFDKHFATELHSLLSDEQLGSTVEVAADAALTSPKAKTFHWMNLAVTGLTICVGCCLLLGLFTRLASVVGALFLLSVMATQPPWVAGANTMFFSYQLVELSALVFLAAVSAGRVAGLDFILHGLWSMCCGRKVA